jgi:hypothetical protein
LRRKLLEESPFVGTQVAAPHEFGGQPREAGDLGIAATDRLRRPAFGLYRLQFPGDFGVEFHPSHGDWIRLLREAHFEIEDLIEVWPSANASTRYPFVTIDWAWQWPAEEVWKVRKPR